MQEGENQMEFDYDTYFAYERKQIDFDKYYDSLAEIEDREWEDNLDD